MGIIVYRAVVSDANHEISEIREVTTEFMSDADAWVALSDWFCNVTLNEGASVYVTRGIRRI